MAVAEVKEHSDEEEEYERDGDEEDDDDDCDAASSSSTTTIGISDHENEISGCVFRSITSFFVEGAEEGLKKKVTMGLVCSFCLWFVLNVAFFMTIDLGYLGTFFGTKTDPNIPASSS